MVIEWRDVNGMSHIINSSDPELISKWLLEKARLFLSYDDMYRYGQIHIFPSENDPFTEKIWAKFDQGGMELMIGTLLQIKREMPEEMDIRSAYPKEFDNNAMDRVITESGDPKEEITGYTNDTEFEMVEKEEDEGDA